MEEMTRAFVDLNLWSLFVTISNTLITFLILKLLLYKPLRKMLAAREQEVRDLLYPSRRPTVGKQKQ